MLFNVRFVMQFIMQNAGKKEEVAGCLGVNVLQRGRVDELRVDKLMS